METDETRREQKLICRRENKLAEDVGDVGDTTKNMKIWKGCEDLFTPKPKGLHVIMQTSTKVLIPI
jgi:hypothetical protein